MAMAPRSDDSDDIDGYGGFRDGAAEPALAAVTFGETEQPHGSTRHAAEAGRAAETCAVFMPSRLWEA